MEDQQVDVRGLSEEKLLELYNYLLDQRININQSCYRQVWFLRGIKSLESLILQTEELGFLGQHNYIIVGTPKEFSAVLRRFNQNYEHRYIHI